MRLLLDTHAFLWFAGGGRRLSPRARKAVERKGAEVYLSSASVWEMAIKSGLGRLSFPQASLEECLVEMQGRGIRPLPVEWRHAAEVARLPGHHRDPFDRLLVAQARTEGLQLVTDDPELPKYDVRVLW